MGVIVCIVGAVVGVVVGAAVVVGAVETHCNASLHRQCVYTTTIIDLQFIPF